MSVCAFIRRCLSFPSVSSSRNPSSIIWFGWYPICSSRGGATPAPIRGSRL
ncbi:hypothetical protein UA08_03823 [Talaromyces atroroseus]|uniref:Uncharacterized protein n=1 Tax=Talaromyces atroroseus TaxID=1441469 RepID=A0A225B2V0_TALAT|nr:hypothetical protein UA08_03823 [Talaromyces atroroseus]OKL61155.1 hypothetical protein UA08_03823 [Talaromyces atroroseus]